MYIIIDNYDSFTYNLYQYISEITDKEIKVIRNDAVKDVKEIEKMNPEAIIISPGPGRPEDAGISVDVIKYFAPKIPLLGVCLGHQAIGYAFGAKIKQARRIVHGKVEEIIIDGKGVFRNIPSPAKFTRYHSLAIREDTLPEELEISAFAQDGEIMGVRHKQYTVEGIQFHPESIASEYGKRLLRNFLNYKRDPFKVNELLPKLVKGASMTQDEAEAFMDEVTEGNMTDAQLAGFLVAITAKGPTSEEIAGCATVLKKKKVSLKSDYDLIDTCGTGGDELGTFNISSLAALVVASCGGFVAKHGNRAMSSKCGSADFFKEMGITIEATPQKAKELLERTGFTFLFAPVFHKAMKYAGQVRRELKLKTIFNLIGPLSNPADASYQLIGVYSGELCLPVAQAAKLLGVKRIMAVHGLDGMDEISVSSPTKIVEIDENNTVKDYIFDPRSIGVNIYRSDELIGGDAKKNVSIAFKIIAGEGSPAITEAVLLNAGAALYIGKIAQSIKEGYGIARNALLNGDVKRKLDQIIEVSSLIQV
jgi:anthranilate synthase/phosphoribosyltransferase